jgi:putative transposon-encoded protein
MVTFGSSTDIPVPGDYDGDGKTDVAVFRPSEGRWYILRSSDSVLQIVSFGVSSDVPVPGDYDGDGKSDPAVFRPSGGRWYILNSHDSSLSLVNFGTATDVLVPADYDGDNKTDVAVYRRSEGRWYVRRSSDSTVVFTNFGAPPIDGAHTGDIPAPGDYDGDGKADKAVFRPSEGRWYILRSTDSGLTLVNWGSAHDPLVAGDDRIEPGNYDGDSKTDVTVFRPGEGRWYIQKSSTASLQMINFGLSTDIPLSLPYALRKVFHP